MDGSVRMKNKNFGLDFEKAWMDIYFMMQDEAFDHTHIMYLDNGTAIAGGARWEEVPF
jgi:acetoacetate decarboxylase